MLYKRSFNIKNKRLIIVASILAIIIALSQIIGYNIDNYYTIKSIGTTHETVIKSVIKFIGLAIIFESIFVVIFNKIESYKVKEDNSENLNFLNSRKMFFIYFLLIVICYTPYFLHYYPGICSNDSLYELVEAKWSMGNLVNHHPVFHIFIIHICEKIGNIFGNSDEYGVAVYSIMQLIFTSFVFSYTSRYLTIKKVNKYIILGIMMFFILYVPFGIYSVTMWKDVPFALFMLLWLIELYELVTNEKYLNNKKQIIKFLTIAIMVILFRNNGIYVVTITLMTSIFAMIGKRKKMLFCTIFIIVFYLLYKGPIFKVLNIKDGPKKEALSIPIQQIARTVKYNGDKLTDEECWRIDSYLPYDEIGDAYYELTSDPVKEMFKEDNFEKDKIGFVKIWGKLLIKYPGEYIDSFLCGCFGYWYPQENNWVIATWDNNYDTPSYKYERVPIVKIDTIDYVSSMINNRKIPLISNLWNVGLVFIVIFVCMGYVIYKKQYRLIMIYIPIIALWLTTIASPVWCEYRYVYSAFTTLPMTTLVAIHITNKNSREKIERIKI